MSRMLEALKQIRAKSAESQPDVQPVSSEELEAFGLRRSRSPSPEHRRRTVQPVRSGHSAASAEPSQAAGSSRASQPGANDASAEQNVAPVTEGVAPQKPALQPAEIAKTDRGIDGLRNLIERHRDQYGDLADNVLRQLSDARPAALMFTSVAEGEGKTIILASLAMVLAERLPDGLIVVDADFRSPALASLFGVRADCGLVDVLTGAARWPDAVRTTGVRGLSLLCGGRFAAPDGCPPHGVDLAPVLEALQRRYPVVLVDTASLRHPEVAPMSKSCQGTYLVVRLGQTPRRGARQSVRLIHRCGGRVLGCVLIDARGEALRTNASGR